MSPVTTTTKSTGGTALLMTPMTVTEPEVAMRPEMLDSFLEGSGLNGPFVADLLSSFLVHEQCGFHLYRTVSALTKNPMLSSKYQESGAQTENHIAVLEQLISDLGGKPGYVSPAARMTEAMNTKMMRRWSSCPDRPTRTPSSRPCWKPWSWPRPRTTPTGGC